MSLIDKQKKNLKFIDKKVDSFLNVERIHCIECHSLKVKFKKRWEWVPYTKNSYNLTSNVECINCGNLFMDSEWDNQI